MQDENYKDTLKEAVRTLVNSTFKIFESMVNVETQGELKDWTATVPAGEVHQFDFDIFKNSKDVNVQLLVKVLENIGDTIKSLVNINALEMDEVEEEDKENENEEDNEYEDEE